MKRSLILGFLLLSLIFGNSRLTLAQKPGGNGGGGTITTYRVVPLSAAEGMIHSMNQSGQMVGQLSGTSLSAHYWQLGPNNSVSAITLDSVIDGGSGPVTLDSVAYGINNEGIIVGAFGDYSSGTAWQPVVWLNAALPVEPLPIPAEFNAIGGGAFGISNQSTNQPGLQAVIVGNLVHDINGVLLESVVAWPVRTTGVVDNPIILETATEELAGTTAKSINSQLAVVGNVNQQAVRWQLTWNGSQLSVVSSTRLFPSTTSSSAEAINEQGDICGTENSKAFLLENVGGILTPRTLAPLVNTSRSGTYNVAARAIDSSATPKVIGAIDVYRKSNGIIDRLNDPVLWQGSSVVDLMKVSTPTTLVPDYLTTINGSGFIGGTAWNGTTRVPVVLIPQ